MNWPTQYQQFIYTRTYSRYIPELHRRENYDESVDRYRDFFAPRVPEKYKKMFEAAIEQIRQLEVMPSMRCFWAAGPALEKENVAGYNCSYLPMDRVKSFAEILYILMCGTGVGISVEKKYVEKLPPVPALISTEDMIEIDFQDSKLGWASGYLALLLSLYDGYIPKCIYSKIRPAGSRLKTMGGRASGPEPLKALVDFTIETFQNAAGRKLKPIEVYDIVGKIADCVVLGGVRRSATLVLSDLDDKEMQQAKHGVKWYKKAPQRARANISVAYDQKPTYEQFCKEWQALAKSGSGERGIFNREGARKKAASLCRPDADFGTNPCGEVLLRPREFCNLTEVVVSPGDTEEELLEKVRYATLLGCLQATLTDFNFLDPEWKKNVEEERLLGVSLTGLMDHPVLQSNSFCARWLLQAMKDAAIDTAEEVSKALGIFTPYAITCVKPSGTVSQLVNASSGIHPRYSRYYLRRVRVDYKDPLAAFLQASGVPCSPEVGQTWDNCNTLVFEFPVRSPMDSVLRNNRTAIEQLEYWKMVNENWCEHNPSVTIYVKPHEWDEVREWVWKHWDDVGGLTFFPYDNTAYDLAPYQEITKAEYEEAVAKMPKLVWEDLQKYEQEDQTTGSQEIACAGGACEL